MKVLLVSGFCGADHVVVMLFSFFCCFPCFLCSCLLKIVVRSTLEDENSKRKALKIVAGVQGVDSLAVDVKDKKITVIGDVDPVFLTSKLRKIGFTELLSVGPAKEEKKDEKKPQNEPKKDKVEVQKFVYMPSISDHNPPDYTVVREEYPTACTIL